MTQLSNVLINYNSMGYKFFHQPKEFLSKVRFDFTLPTNFGVEEQVEP